MLTSYYSNERMRAGFIYTLKLFLLLYIAACLWNILSGIKDGLVKALQPVITAWEVLVWLLHSGW